MARNVAAALGLKPALGRRGIGHGLERGEGFAGNQKQRVLGLELAQHRRQFMPIDIGNKVKAFALGNIVIECQHRHLRPQVGAANADVDDVGDGRIQAHRLRKRQHRRERLMHLRQFAGKAFG